MSQQRIAIFLSLLLIFSLLLGTCGPAVQATEAPAASRPAEIAHPAAKYCKENDGKLEIRTAQDGSQSGDCEFPDGSESEARAFFGGHVVLLRNPRSYVEKSTTKVANRATKFAWLVSGVVSGPACNGCESVQIK